MMKWASPPLLLFGDYDSFETGLDLLSGLSTSRDSHGQIVAFVTVSRLQTHTHTHVYTLCAIQRGEGSSRVSSVRAEIPVPHTSGEGEGMEDAELIIPTRGS